MRAIREDPGADAPRLACAADLSERGDSRGEYITLACRHAAAGGYGVSTDETERLRLQLRAFEPHEEAWAKPLYKLGAIGIGTDRLSFLRGFIDSAKVRGRATANVPAACRLEPIVRLVLEDAGRRRLAALADAPEIALLRHVFIGGSSDGTEKLLVSPHLANLHEIRVSRPWSPAILDALARGPVRPRIVEHLPVALAELERLVAAGFYARTEDYFQADATDATILALVRGPLASLRRLAFYRCDLSVRAFEALAPILDQLETLSLAHTPLDPDIAAVLIAHMRGGNLRSLKVEGSGGTAGLDAFVGSPAFRGVEELDLMWGPCNPEALERSPYRGNLRKVSVGWGVRKTYLELPGVEVCDYHEGGW